MRQYLEEYRKSDRRKTSPPNQEAGHLRRDEEAMNSILITWQKHKTIGGGSTIARKLFQPIGIHEALLRGRNSTANRRDGKNEDKRRRID